MPLSIVEEAHTLPNLLKEVVTGLQLQKEWLTWHGFVLLLRGNILLN